MSLFEQEFQLEPREPVDVAEVLKRVEGSPFYYEALRRRFGMCFAISEAYVYDLITKEEQQACSEALDWYLHQFTMHNKCSPNYLRTALHLAGLRSDEYDLRKIYKDWNNRPQPWSNEKC
jgi:hypothetical protein